MKKKRDSETVLSPRGLRECEYTNENQCGLRD